MSRDRDIRLGRYEGDSGARRATVAVAAAVAIGLLLAPSAAVAKPRVSKPRLLDAPDAIVTSLTMLDGRGRRAAAVWKSDRSRRADEVSFAQIDAKGRPGKRLRVARRRRHIDGGPQAASSAGGATTAIWIDRGGDSAAAGFAQVALATVDASGRLVRKLDLERKPKGHNFIPDAPEVATGPNGRGVALWAHIPRTSPIGPSGPTELRWVRLGRDGTPDGEVHSTIISFNYGDRLQADVDLRGRVNVVISHLSQVRFLRISPDDEPGAETVLGGGQNEPARGVELVTDRRGRTTVAWWHQASEDRIEARRIAGDGTVGPLIDVSGPDSGLRDPALAVDSWGRAAITWTRSRRGTSRALPGRIYLARLDREDDPTSPQPVTPRRNRTAHPDVAVDGRNRIYVTFQRRARARKRGAKPGDRWRAQVAKVSRTLRLRWRRKLGRGDEVTVGGQSAPVFAWDRPSNVAASKVVSRLR